MDKLFSHLQHNWEHIVLVGLALQTVTKGLLDALTAANAQKQTGVSKFLFVIQATLSYLLGKRAQ